MLADLAREGAMALAGGTSMVLLLKSRLVSPSALVWLGRVGELGGIDPLPGGGLRVGANVRVGELARSELIRREAPALARAASVVGNPRVRAVATLGGALAHADPRQDLPPVLLALGASVTLAGPSGRREVPLERFFLSLMETEVRPGELITEVAVPPGPGRRLAYARYAPGSEDDYPTVGAAAAVTMSDGVVERAVVALGGVGPTPLLVPGLDPLLAGRAPDESALGAAAEAAQAAVRPTDDQRGSAAYKRAMAGVFTKRVLESCLSPHAR
ncbi:MAG: xanthine dehydrogenase family protein subunit M [Acidimicrobiales bacterium]|nr:xanthine dehydrogenase family protein subunit M [Acidimicrobiales bacterium]